jgi:membrane protease YdiL (CAAX protease family)
MPLLDAVTVAVLLVALPALAVAQARALRGSRIPRLPAYASSAATLVLLGGWCVGLGLWRQGPAAMGFVPMPLRLLAGWALVVTVAGIGVMLGFRIVCGALGVEESPILRALLPRTGNERLAFAGLSVIAGLCEEVIFRGYALPVLAGVTGVVAAGVLTSVAFGALHAYQGVLGVVRTAALGGILAWAFVAAGSVWPVVAAHTVLDLLGGIVLAERLMSPARDGGVG